MKCGLFGGTFDPIHFGHLRAAQELVESLKLEHLLFIPSALPPHKSVREVAPFPHRLQMLKLALAGNDDFSFSDVEFWREGKSYSIDTVRYFLNFYGQGAELYFILGQDAFNKIASWHQWEQLLSLCHFVVMTRPGYQNQGLKNILPQEMTGDFVYDSTKSAYVGKGGSKIYFQNVTFLDISSSRIRAQIKAGCSIRYLLPDSVVSYIARHGLYKD